MKSSVSAYKKTQRKEVVIMKKFLSIVMAMVLLLSLSACGQGA